MAATTGGQRRGRAIAHGPPLPCLVQKLPKPLLFKRHKVVRFLISPINNKMKIEVNKIMNLSDNRSPL